MKLKEINKDFYDVDAWLNETCGQEGSPEREAFRKEAEAYCVGQIIHDARKEGKITQSELASRIGTNKAYISKIENGLIEPGVGLFFRIIDALGLRWEIDKPVL